jgi:hypothetical protein
LLGLLLSAPQAYGGKVYKWIIDGKTVYMDKKPNSGKGKVEEKHVDDERNVIHMTPAGTEGSGSQNTGPQRSTQTTKNKKSTATQNQTGKNAAGSTGTTSRGREPDETTKTNTETNPGFVRGKPPAQTNPGFVRGTGGGTTATPGPAVTPGPGF